MSKLVIIQCVKEKIWNINSNAPIFVQAGDAYISDYFKKMKEYAQLINADKILIFSAWWSLITLNYKIKNYNVTFNNKNTHPLTEIELALRIPAGKINFPLEDNDIRTRIESGTLHSCFNNNPLCVTDVRQQNEGNRDKIVEYNKFDEIIILGGQDYIKRLSSIAHPNILRPFQDNNLGGIGYILKWLKEQILILKNV